MAKKSGKPISDVARDEELRQVVESIGLWFEEGGVPRMAGRIVGWLLVCDPPEQTMQELADGLEASMGSISTMTRLLTQIGLIERTSNPGERRIRFRIRADAWSWTIDDRINHLRSFVDIADKAVTLLDGTDPVRRQRMETLTRGIRFYEEELSRLATKWRETAAGGG